MKKKIMLFNKLVSYFLFFMLAMNLTVMSQDEDNNEKEQMQVIQNEISDIYSKKMEAALKKDMVRFNKMKEEAEGIEKKKDDNGKKEAVDNYQKAHKGYYMKLMNSAGLNIKSILAHLKKKFTGYSFTSSDGISIEIEKIVKEIPQERGNSGFINEMNENEPGIARKISGPNPVAGPVYMSVFEEDNINLAPSKSINCALASGGSVNFWSPNSMRASSAAAIAGGCGAKGNLQYGFSVPSAIRYMRVVLSGSLRHYGYAVAIGGVSMIVTKTEISVYVSSLDKYLFKNYISKSKVAPLLWAARYDESRSLSGNVDVTSYKSKGVQIKAMTHTYNISEFISSTTGYCQINLPTVKKVFERL